MPDYGLSACSSCQNGYGSDGWWSAECCGVTVSGIAFKGMVGDSNDGRISGWDVSATSGTTYRLFCIMTYPVMATHYYVPYSAVYSTTLDQYTCADSFVPECAFKKCDNAAFVGGSGNYGDQ